MARPAASKRAKAAVTEASSATSNALTWTEWPAERSASAAAPSFAGSRPFSTMAAPASARPRAIARPSPPEEPVTSAVLPPRSNKAGTIRPPSGAR